MISEDCGRHHMMIVELQMTMDFRCTDQCSTTGVDSYYSIFHGSPSILLLISLSRCSGDSERVWIGFNLFITSSYSKFGGRSSFRFASDSSVRNYREQPKCNVAMNLNWKKELQSSCISAPLLFPIHQDGERDVGVVHCCQVDYCEFLLAVC